MRQVGMRVGAILSGNNEEVKLLGYGVYEGDFIPPYVPTPTIEYIKDLFADPELGAIKHLTDEGAQVHLDMLLKSAFLVNPRIRLDDGDIVWGRECWWGSEEKVRAAIGQRRITHVAIVRGDNGEPLGTGEQNKSFGEAA